MQELVAGSNTMFNPIRALCFLASLAAPAAAQTPTVPVVVTATFGELKLPLDLGSQACVGLKVLASCSAPSGNPTENCTNYRLADQFCKRLGYSFPAAFSA